MANFYRVTSVIMGLLWVAGCASPVETSAAKKAAKTSASTAGFAKRLSWGQGSEQVGGRSPGWQRVAEGPTAVAVGEDGAAYVLDRLNGRVLRVTGRSVSTAAQVPPDAEVLATGTDGADGVLLAAWSPLRARVWLRGAAGADGSVQVPRALRLARSISLGNSRQVLVENAHQETYRLGSPATQRSLAAVLHSKREGSAFLADGSGLQVRRRGDGRAEILVHSEDRRGAAPRLLPLADRVAAARLIGAAGDVACLRLEKMTPPSTAVRREAVCVRTSDGVEVLRKDLGLPGRYVPRQELALGGSPARLAWIHPTAQGLEVTVWALPRTARTEVTP